MLSVAQAASECPERPALVSDEGVMSYRELAAEVQPRASWLLGLGLPHVAVVAQRRRESVLMMFAAIEAGIPLVLLHPRWSPSERRAALEQVGAHLPVDEDFVFPAAESGEAVAPVPTPAAIDPEQCLAVVFTSGSTGRPRGVLLSRRAMIAAAGASAAHLGWNEGDHWLVSLPLAHVGGFSILIRTLLARRTAVLAAPGSPTAAELSAAIDRHGVTLMSLVPTTLARLLDQQPPWQPGPALRAILVGGAGCPAGLSQRAHGRGWPVLLSYGMTETCGQVATARLGAAPSDSGAIGPLLEGVQVRIEADEILVAGPTVCSGFLAAEGSALDAQGRFHSGDLGSLDEAGDLVVLGRADARINSGGEKVHPSEVEAAILSFPGVAEAAVVGVPDTRWGEAVAAGVQPADSVQLDVSALQSHLRQQLAPWKRPQRLRLLAELPRTASDKVDRARLRELLAPPS
jgi:O-succinylbenzoic acid--CoA ligase